VFTHFEQSSHLTFCMTIYLRMFLNFSHIWMSFVNEIAHFLKSRTMCSTIPCCSELRCSRCSTNSYCMNTFTVYNKPKRTLPLNAYNTRGEKQENTPSSRSRGYQKKQTSSKSETSYNSSPCSSSDGPFRQQCRREKECARPLTVGAPGRITAWSHH